MIKILNQNRELVAIAENAINIRYEKAVNEIWSAGFSLPLNDPKNEACKPLNFVEIISDLSGEYIGLFRIIPALTRKSESANVIEYELEHVLATLMDDVLFRYHQTTNLKTSQNIEYLLDRQTTKHWRLGKCEFTRYFSYSWENENGLASPLFSIPQPFDEHYEWTYDTTSYPWTLNLVRPQTEITCEIRYGKNLREIERNIDPTNLVNRIFPLGSGEGVNQLNITKVNANKPYLENADSIAEYGLRSYVWVDRRFQDADSLKASAQALLDEWSTPKVTYKVKAADLSVLTGVSIDKLTVGKVVRVIDPDIGTFEARIVSESKSDLVGAPGDVELEIANKTEDLGTTIDDLTRRHEINEMYAQGATNIDSREFNDNADSTHPAVIRFFLPNDVVNINELLLTWECTKFRVHGKATKGGGATATTTSSGGGSTQTSSSGGGVAKSTASGGGTTQSSSSGGGTSSTTTSKDWDTWVVESSPQIGEGTSHNHRVTLLGNWFSHQHTFTVPNHSHSVTIPSHTHSFDVPNHTHNLTIPNHTHSLTLPDHTHDISFGIYELDELPSSVQIKVDGNTVPSSQISGENLDIIPYLSRTQTEE